MKNGEKGPGRPHGAAGRGRGMAQRGAFGGQGTDGAALAVRPAAWADLAEILAVYAQARAFMRANGNASQWRDSHPPRALVEQDIAEGTEFVLVSGGGRVEGVFALLDGEDPAYARIEDGAWLSDAPYCAIHRIASAGRVRGVLRACVAWSARRCAHLRADTHADNAPMLRLLPALGFVRCGVVRVADGSPRIAFERLPQDGRA